MDGGSGPRRRKAFATICSMPSFAPPKSTLALPVVASRFAKPSKLPPPGLSDETVVSICPDISPYHS